MKEDRRKQSMVTTNISKYWVFVYESHVTDDVTFYIILFANSTKMARLNVDKVRLNSFDVQRHHQNQT